MQRAIVQQTRSCSCGSSRSASSSAAPSRGGRIHARRHSDRMAAAPPPLHRSERRRAVAVAVAAITAPTDVLVLDFDGVLVDSEPEVSSSAVAAASARWPEAFAAADAAALAAGMRSVRPVLINGYEAMAMARLLAEAGSSNAAVVQSILADWPALLESTLARWGEDAAALTAAFEAHRAAAIKSSDGGRLERWLALNQAYPGIPAALAECPYPFYIATSKAASRVAVLCERNLGLPLPVDSPRLMCSLLPPNEKKIEALRDIEARPLVAAAPDAALHFIDDRLETLLAIAEAPGLERWRLYHASWGYSTAAERAEAAAHAPRVRPLTLPALREMLRWGLAMGVDDGCEPTAEEISAGVE